MWPLNVSIQYSVSRIRKKLENKSLQFKLTVETIVIGHMKKYLCEKKLRNNTLTFQMHFY